jgi:hypothetical protein
MPDAFKIAEILASHAVSAHGDDIGIIAYYGSHAKGLATDASDLDIFYIPDEGKARTLNSQFVLDGLPYDFWPLSWARAEAIADARRDWAVSASLIADAKVLYHRSQSDLNRLNGLKGRIAELVSPTGRKTMIERSLDEFKNTLFQLGQMRLARAENDEPGMRWAGLKFVNSAINCLALANQTYFTKGWGANLPQVMDMRHKPDGLEEMIRTVTMAGDAGAVLDSADRLAKAVRGILIAAYEELYEPREAGDVFRDFYFFVFEYTNKIVAACERGDAMAANAAAFLLQYEMGAMMNQVEKGCLPSDVQLLGEYSAPYGRAGFPDLLALAARGDLEGLARQARRLDEKARDWLQSHSIPLNILSSEEELRRFLTERDPA